MRWRPHFGHFWRPSRGAPSQCILPNQASSPMNTRKRMTTFATIDQRPNRAKAARSSIPPTASCTTCIPRRAINPRRTP
jgi:hypothetical protein